MRSFKMAASIIVKNNSKSVFRYLFCKKLFSSTACLNDALKDSKMMQKFLQKKQRYIYIPLTLGQHITLVLTFAP